MLCRDSQLNRFEVSVVPAEFQESELLTEAIKGDTVALERLLLCNYSRIERYLAPKVPDSAKKHFDTEDVLQEVFTQAFRSISNFEPRTTGGFVAWLKTIADHRLSDALRRIKAKKRGGAIRQWTPHDQGLQSTVAQLIDLVSHESSTASKYVARREATSAINVGLASLPEDQRFALRARFYDGQEVETIAKVMNRSPGAVRGLIYRAQKNLADMMGRSSQWLTR
jgi:RNA polymerase sigma-70 factor, ECF subfamily